MPVNVFTFFYFFITMLRADTEMCSRMIGFFRKNQLYFATARYQGTIS